MPDKPVAKEQGDRDKPVDRRTFAAALAATGAALAGCGTAPVPAPEVAKVDVPRGERKPEVIEPAVPEPGQSEEKPEPVEMPPLPDRVDALVLELVKFHYPQRLEAEHLKAIRGEIQRQLARSQVLSAFPLKNSDEPAPVFAAYRGPG